MRQQYAFDDTLYSGQIERIFVPLTSGLALHKEGEGDGNWYCYQIQCIKVAILLQFSNPSLQRKPVCHIVRKIE